MAWGDTKRGGNWEWLSLIDSQFLHIFTKGCPGPWFLPSCPNVALLTLLCRCKRFFCTPGGRSAHREHPEAPAKGWSVSPHPAGCPATAAAAATLPAQGQGQFLLWKVPRAVLESPCLFRMGVNGALWGVCSNVGFGLDGAAIASLDPQYPRTNAVCHFRKSQIKCWKVVNFIPDVWALRRFASFVFFFLESLVGNTSWWPFWRKARFQKLLQKSICLKDFFYF